MISIGAVPGVLAGIATILYFTNTSLNIESFMGSIMCLGVSVSNSVMLVTFMDEHWKGGASSTEAAIVGAGERLRPILMTACAMTVGMVPMALALERGSQMQAPLGLAVIGGLVMSTFATLLVLPSIFAVVIGRKVARSPSIYPDDPESSHYDPQVFVDEDEPATTTARSARRRACAGTHHQDDDALAFLRSILDEARSKRHDMVTHYTVDDLRVALGFAKPGPTTATPAPGGTPRPTHRPRTGSGRRWRSCPGDPESDAPSNARTSTRGPSIRAASPFLEVPDAPLPWPTISDRSAGCRLAGRSGSWPPSRRRAAATRPEVDFTSVSKPPTVQVIQPAGPEHRPGRRPAELHRELTSARRSIRS